MSELRRNLQINGRTYYLAVNQYGAGAPTQATPGKPGVLYMDTDDGMLYKCMGADGGVYSWEKAFSGGSDLSPVPKTSGMTQKVGADGEGKLWTRYISGCLHTADLSGAGVTWLDIPLESVNLVDANYTITFGDKILTNDGYLYEISGFSIGSGTVYSGRLIFDMVGRNSMLPDHTGAQEGQVLRIVNGVPAWSSIN